MHSLEQPQGWISHTDPSFKHKKMPISTTIGAQADPGFFLGGGAPIGNDEADHW